LARISASPSVLDAVVHHLGEMTGTRRPTVHPTTLGRRSERLQDRQDRADCIDLAADHQPVAVFETPHAAGHTGIDECGDAAGKFARVALAVLVHGVGAVDHDVAARQQSRQLVERVFCRRARRQHQPHDSGCRQQTDEGRECPGRSEVRFGCNRRARF
jgi:hypothetical protein